VVLRSSSIEEEAVNMSTHLECQRCGYDWDYTGDKQWGTCPNCKTSVKAVKETGVENPERIDLEQSTEEAEESERLIYTILEDPDDFGLVHADDLESAEGRIEYLEERVEEQSELIETMRRDLAAVVSALGVSHGDHAGIPLEDDQLWATESVDPYDPMTEWEDE
jgi:hypothetical protein